MKMNTLSIKQLIQEYRDEQLKNMILREDFSRLHTPKSIQMTTLVDDQHYSTEYQVLSNDILNIYGEEFEYDQDYPKYLEATPLSSNQIKDIKERYSNRNYYNHYQTIKRISNQIERRPNKNPHGYFKYIKNECSDYDETDYYMTVLDDSYLDQKFQHKHGWLYEYLVFYSITFSSDSGSRYYYWLKNRHSFNHKFLPQFTFDAPDTPLNMILSMFHTINPRIDKAETELERAKELYATFNYFVDWLLWSIGYPYINNTLKTEGINPDQYSDYLLENSHNILTQMDWEVLYLWQTNFLQELWDLLFENPSEIESKESIKEKIKTLNLDDEDIHQHITLNDINNSNYLLELSNYFFSICSLNEYDLVTADIHIKMTTVISYFYIPWAVIPPNKRAIKKESIITINSYGSLIELDEQVFEETKIPKNTYPVLIKDSKKRNEMKSQELNLAFLPEKTSSELNQEETFDYSEGELIDSEEQKNVNLPKGEPINSQEDNFSFSEGEPINHQEDNFSFSEGEPLSFSEGEPLDFAEGEPLSFSEGEPLNFSEGESFNFSEGKQINMSEGENLNITEGEVINNSLNNYISEEKSYNENLDQEDNKDPLPPLEKINSSKTPLSLSHKDYKRKSSEEEYEEIEKIDYLDEEV